MCLSDGVAAAVHKILTGSKACRQVGQLRGAREVAVVIHEARKEPVIAAKVVIDTNVKCIGVLNVRTDGLIVVLGPVRRAFNIRQRKRVQIIQRCTVQPTLWNHIAKEGRASERIVDCATHVIGCGQAGAERARRLCCDAGGAEQFGEIPLAHECRRHSHQLSIQRLILAQPLVITKDEGMVFPDRSADRTAERVALERQRCRRCSADEAVIRIRIKEAGPTELESRTMDCIAARFDGCLHDSTTGPTKFRRRCAGVHAKLFCPFNVREEVECIDE